MKAKNEKAESKCIKCESYNKREATISILAY